jgi:hypothetical protein
MTFGPIASLLCSGANADPEWLVNLRAAAGVGVKWDTKSAVRADVDCDGKPDTVAAGYAKGPTVWIGVVSASKDAGSNRLRLFHFPAFETANEDAFCSAPVMISTSKLDCKVEDGRLPGCRTQHDCSEFAVVDGQCDSFHFYWDSRHHKLSYWRL